MHKKLDRDFFKNPALETVRDFLGKYLVYNSPQGRLVGKIIDVEAYPAFVDKVSHGNKRTARTEVMYKEGGYVYVYLIYGIHHQFAIVVNKKEVPEVVFIRALEPVEGIEIMKKNFGRPVKSARMLTKSPGNLCRSFGITLDLYGEDITGDKIYIEDRGEKIGPKEIKTAGRVGISLKLEGNKLKYRYYL